MIDTKALRSRVLDLAIQGKLTEQLDSDGTAEELYQQIQVEKQKLVKEGKIKKEKPLPEISADDIPFEIPSNWKWTRVKELTLLYNGKAFKPSDWSTSGLPIVRIQNLNNEDAPYNYYDKPIEEEYHLYGGELLFAWSGTPGTSFGAHIWKNQEAVLNQHIFKLVFNEKAIYKEYFMYVLNQRVSTLFNFVHGSAGLQHVTKGTFESTLISLPPLAEQKRIVERVEEIFRVLDTIDEAQEKYLADVESLRSKLITAGIQGRLTQQLDTDGTADELYQQIQAEKQKLIKEGKLKKEKPLPPISPEEIPFEIPGNWKWCHLGECIRLQSGQDFKPSDYNADNEGTPYLTGASNIDELGNLIINRWTEKPTCIAEKNDVLIVCKGSGYGKITICTIDYAHIARQFMAVKYSDFIDTKFMKLFLISNLTVIKGNGQGLIPGIDRPSVLNLPFPLPPLAEQKRIADVLEKALRALE